NTVTMNVVGYFIPAPFISFCRCPVDNKRGSMQKTNQLMNKKFLPGAVLFIIAFVLSNLTSLARVKAQNNTFYGDGAGINTTTGTFDSAFGYAALYYNTSGSQNTAIGWSALHDSTTSDQNTAIGSQVLEYNTTGSGNTATGAFALLNNTTGN